MHQKLLILIVDDDADIRTIVNHLFTTLGYRVKEAADGLTAFVRARQLAPALIVLDLGLPGRDGWTVARELRADPALEHIPILALTAYSLRAALQAARDAGCQEVLCKPFELHTLEHIAHTLLGAF